MRLEGIEVDDERNDVGSPLTDVKNGLCVESSPSLAFKAESPRLGFLHSSFMKNENFVVGNEDDCALEQERDKKFPRVKRLDGWS